MIPIYHPGHTCWLLDGRKVVRCPDLAAWFLFFETANRRVAQTYFGDVKILTDFIGSEHVIFETMVFGGPLNYACERYSTWEEAEAGHEAMVQRVIANARVN